MYKHLLLSLLNHFSLHQIIHYYLEMINFTSLGSYQWTEQFLIPIDITNSINIGFANLVQPVFSFFFIVMIMITVQLLQQFLIMLLVKNLQLLLLIMINPYFVDHSNKLICPSIVVLIMAIVSNQIISKHILILIAFILLDLQLIYQSQLTLLHSSCLIIHDKLGACLDN